MSLYHDCVSLFRAKGIMPTRIEEKGISLPSTSVEARHTTVPALISREDYPPKTLDVYYISDLHLVHHLINQFPHYASDEDISNYIHSVVLNLFKGDYGDEIRQFHSPVTLFGGDVSSLYKISELFYCDFIQTMRAIQDERYNELAAVFDPIETELSQVSTELSVWKAKNPNRAFFTKPISEYSDRTIPRRIKELFEREDQLKSELRDNLNERGVYSRWRELYQCSSDRTYIYAVLGNHELWDFSSYDECISAYKELFETLGIHFLNGSISWLGAYSPPAIDIRDEKNGKWKRALLSREDDPQKYDELEILNGNTMIVGDIGYASLNDGFNASQGIYGTALDTDQEEELSRRWQDLLINAQGYAKKHHSLLVVLTHMPMSDWLSSPASFSNCVFFSGHTHQNETWSTENNTFFYADGQVGYSSDRFRFKCASLHRRRNPFAGEPDGFREISIDEYKEFYCFANEASPGTGNINRQIKEYGGKLYVIKQEDYYGFFLTTCNSVCICNGGQPRSIGCLESLERYNLDFMKMVNFYLRALSPLRQMQEKLSHHIRSFGGTGKIHGTIVDIDSENHIMINTSDGTLTYYHSPRFGLVKTYPSIGLLLHEHCPELEKSYLASGTGLVLANETQLTEGQDSPYEHIDIKNSPYAISRRVNALQRLFDKHILRDWNQEVISEVSNLHPISPSDNPTGN